MWLSLLFFSNLSRPSCGVLPLKSLSFFHGIFKRTFCFPIATKVSNIRLFCYSCSKLNCFFSETRSHPFLSKKTKIFEIVIEFFFFLNLFYNNPKLFATYLNRILSPVPLGNVKFVK